jgi:hypothetical protein
MALLLLPESTKELRLHNQMRWWSTLNPDPFKDYMPAIFYEERRSPLSWLDQYRLKYGFTIRFR